MFRLKKKNPPFGTAESPVWEYAYSEQVKVVEGLCVAQNASTRDYLVKLGYEEILDEEPAPALAGSNGHSPEGHEETKVPDEPVVPIHSRRSSKKKRRR